MFSETRRQLIHVSMCGFALALRVLTWWQAALCALTALVFNAVILPSVAGFSLSRPVDRARGYVLGILLYPLAVLLLILAFPTRPDVAGAAWGILACGDGAATLAGRNWGRHHLPWNPRKSWEGTLAFVVAGSAAAAGLAWWNAPAAVPAPPVWFLCGATITAAAAAALAETVPIGLDDNLTVPAVAASVLWAATLVDSQLAVSAWPVVAERLPMAVLLNAVVAALSWRAGSVRATGVVTGFVIGVMVWTCTGWQGWGLLFAAFLAASVSSRLGLRRKSVLGIAEERGGRRGGGNVFANTGLAAVAAVLAVMTPLPDAARFAMVAALAAGASDTVASEIGKAWGRRTFLVTTWQQVRPGTPGAVSREGSVAGLAAAVGLGIAAAGLGLIAPAGVWVIAAAATVGAWMESAMAATLEGPGLVNNDVLNFLNTAAAALAALVMMRWV